MCATRHKWLVVLLLLAFFRGALYALYMPPWGLLDEEQHFDYILKLAKNARPPITGKDTLDPQLVDSILDTNRHQKFHWLAPKSTDPAKWGLEGHSYEGYQGPFFYVLCVPVYLLFPGDLVSKLFGLRLWMVILSLVTVWASYQITRELYPEEEKVAMWVGLLVVCIPERTGSTGRLTNDVMLEVISILFLWMSIRAAMRGITWKRALGIGILAGLGILTKISFIGILLLPFPFLLNLRNNNTFKRGILSALVAGLLCGPFLFYSYKMYGDPTGFRGFSDLYQSLGGVLWNPHFTFSVVVDAVWKIFGSFWFVWWNGANGVYGNWLQIFWIAILAVVFVSMWGFFRRMVLDYKQNRQRFWTLTGLMSVIVIFLMVTGWGYFQGKFPVIHGRFLLPILYPVTLIICLGLKYLRQGKIFFLVFFVVLIIFDGLLLFGNLLPYHYFYSEFIQSGQVTYQTWSGWPWAINLFLLNFLSDKPVWVIAGCVAALAGYVILLARLFGQLLFTDKFFQPKQQDYLGIL